MGEPSADKDGGGERGRAEQKGRVKRDINSQRATLLEWVESAWGGESWGWKKGRGDAHALMAPVLWDGIELFLERPIQ